MPLRTNEEPVECRTHAGGLSGGEAAIIAAGGSLMGFGSGGGGIRQHAHSCGIKPTGWRLSFRGHRYVPNWLSD